MNMIADFRRDALDSIKVKSVDVQGNVFLWNVLELRTMPKLSGGYEIEIIVDMPPAAKAG